MPCKVDRVVADFGLTGTGDYDDVDEELLARWQGADAHEEHGYRTLTDWFNKRLLKQVYDANGRETLGPRVESDYEALTGEDRLLRAEVLDGLRADGIDADAVADALVSWSTMRHHLKDCLDGSKQRSGGDSEWERDSVAHATEWAEQKVGDALRSLTSKGEIDGGDEAEVSVEAYLQCPVCGVRVSLSEAHDRGYVCRDHLGESGG